MSSQKVIELLHGTIRQTEREAAAKELYLNAQIKTLKGQLQEKNREAFKAGWVARDSTSGSRHVSYENVDEHGDDWFAAWQYDEDRKL